MKLQRDDIVRTALALLNEVGMDGLTTRRLAERLSVQSPALYWHFKNKRALLDALAAAMLADHACPVPPPGADWQAWALDNARSFRRALLAYRDGARIHAGTAPGADMVPRIDAQLRLLCGAGFAPADALRAMVAIGRYTVGWVLEEQAELESGATEVPGPTAADVKSYPLVAQGLKGWRKSKPDANFDFGVRLMIAGLAAQLATQPPATPAPGRRKDSAPRQTAA